MLRLVTTHRAARTLAACLTAFAVACGGADAVTIPTPGSGGGTGNGGNGGTGGTGGQTPAPVATVSLTPNGATVTVGRTTTLGAALRDAQGNTLTGRTIAWTSAADSIARIDANGVITGVAIGSTTVTATSEGQSASATIAVQPVQVAAVSVAPATATVKLGETATLTATVKDDAGNALAGRVVRWSSSAPAVASVDSISGVVRGLASGAASITATSEGKSGSASVSVIVPVASVSVATALDTLEAYDVVQMQAITKDANGNVLNGRVIRWTSSNAAVATIDSVSGALTGLDRGTVTVTATSEGKSGSATRVVVIKYRSIAAGTMHNCDIASGGIVWCWGLNGREGRIGNAQVGDNSLSATPVRVPNTGPNATRFVQLSAYGTTTCGLATDGKAWCWGSNSWSALGSGTSISQSATPVAVAGGMTFKQISVGADHTCAVTAAGALYCWGHNDWRQFGSANPYSSDTPVLAAAGLTFQSVAAASSFSCGVTTSGAGYCFGSSGLGQLGDGAKISFGNTFSTGPVAVTDGLTFRTIDAGSAYSCGLTTTGKAYCWGSNGGKLGDGPNKPESSSPVAVVGGYTFESLSAGAFHACGITTDAAIYCWGANKDGQLGNGTLVAATSPTRAAGSLRAAEVAAAGIATGSGSHTCAIAQDRLTTYCWGLNSDGQLGNGTSTGANVTGTPTPSIVVGQKPLP